MSILGVVSGVFLIVAWLAATRCTFRVAEGHHGVLVRFGAARRSGSALAPFRPGLHFKWPWERALVVPTLEQHLSLANEPGGTSAMAKDGTVLRFDAVLRYAPVPMRLEEWLFGLENPAEHAKGLFTSLLRSELANFGDGGGSDPGGSYAQVRRARKELAARIEEVTRRRFGEAYGARFEGVDLKDVLPPDGLAAALNAVIGARAEVETTYARAEAESARTVMAAERGVEVAATRARAAEAEIVELCTFLDELEGRGVLGRYVQRRRTEVLSQSKTLFLGGAR